MREPENPKPRPARPAPAAKPTPARELAGAEPQERTGVEAEPMELTFESRGTMWRATLLGRSGRAHPRSPPLLLLGFCEGDAPPSRETLVVAHALSDLTPTCLQAAFERSSAPPSDEQEKPFFEGTGRGRRGGGAGRES